MRKKLFLLILFQLSFIYNIFSQTNEENIEKYWNYKNRLKYYVNPVSLNTISNAGEGLIMTARNWPGDPNHIASDIYGSYGQQNITLGYYIGVLATEFKLFMDNGQTTDAYKTLDKLDKELDALKRKDNTI